MGWAWWGVIIWGLGLLLKAELLRLGDGFLYAGDCSTLSSGFYNILYYNNSKNIKSKNQLYLFTYLSYLSYSSYYLYLVTNNQTYMN